MRQARGMALGSVLMFIGTAMMVAFTLVAVVSFQMSTGLRQTGAHAAHNAAESALSVALARIGESHGTFGSVGNEEIRVPGLEGEVGIVTFQGGRTEARQSKTIAVPRSTHNFTPLNPTTARPGYDRTVPKDSIDLIATGITESGVVSRIEAIAYFPPFTYAIASSGALTLNSVTVAGVKDPATAPRDADGTPSLDPTHLSTGDVGCNRTMDLTGSTVKGDARASGSIRLTGTTVEGETRQNAAPLKLPTINLDDYDPGTQTVALDIDATFTEPTVSGNMRRQGDLTVPGDLRLDNGLLYVTGSLTVNGGLKGKGLVVVHGNATIAGAVSVEATDNTALLCGGDVTISGGAVFQGLVFTRGNFRADHVKLVGCFIQNSANPAATMQLSSVDVVYQNNLATVSIFRPGSFLLCDSDVANPIYSEAIPNYDGTTTLNRRDPTQPAPNLDALVRPDLQAQWGTDEFTDYCHKHHIITVTKRNGGLIYSLIFRGRSTEGAADGYPPGRILVPGSPWFDFPTDTYPGRCLSIYEYGDLDALLQSLAVHQDWEGLSASDIQAWRNAVTARIDQAMAVDVPIAVAQNVNFKFDPSRFLTPFDEMRVLYWSDL